jgi:hypothetical protein
MPLRLAYSRNNFTFEELFKKFSLPHKKILRLIFLLLYLLNFDDIVYDPSILIGCDY